MIFKCIPFFIALTVIVFVHELGHFLLARHYGIQVQTFSIGFGTELFGWTDKKGTRWRFSLIPLGGYVMMLGDSDPSSSKANLKGLTDDEKKQTLHLRPPLQRMMVAFGGPFFNILLTISLLAIICLGKGIPNMTPRIHSVAGRSLAASVGLREGDVITAINDCKISFVSEIKKQLSRSRGKSILLNYERNGKLYQAPLQLWENDKKTGKKIPLSLLGVTFDGELSYKKASLIEAFHYGFLYCYDSALGLFSGLSRSLSGQKNGVQIGGLLAIGDGAQKSFSAGLFKFLEYMAALSLSLGIFNLLPIPVLDGGSIFLGFIEVITRRPLSVMVTNIVSFLGLCLVICMMLWSFWNDFVRYGIVDKIIRFVKSAFGQ
jgi:regulator of sigma E protease